MKKIKTILLAGCVIYSVNSFSQSTVTGNSYSAAISSVGEQPPAISFSAPTTPTE
ncbi:hypothetical protein [Fluviicola sp.]|uniref:hypothetical protein n=1 Tax=Fluviicola sp. TaxID=1917219 RepID=UPI003D2B11CD